MGAGLRCIGGCACSRVFCSIETRVEHPMFDLDLFRIRAFTLGNLASLLAALGRGGLKFILIIWLQGIWLPRHGYSFESTPLWAGIFMLPMTVGFLVAGPLSGWLSDRLRRPLVRHRRHAARGGVSFVWFAALPVDFAYWMFAAAAAANGFGMGLFASPNRAAVMNSLPANRRGVGRRHEHDVPEHRDGALDRHLLLADDRRAGRVAARDHATGLTAHGVPAADARRSPALPPVGGAVRGACSATTRCSRCSARHSATLPAGQADYLTGHSFFPPLISGPVRRRPDRGLRVRDRRVPGRGGGVVVLRHAPAARTPRRGPGPAFHESVGAELAAEAGELVRDDDTVPTRHGRHRA